VKAAYLWLSSFACLPLAGWPLLAHTSYGSLSLPARIGLAFAAGAALLSGWMTALALIGLPWQPAVLIALAGATAFLLRLCLSSERANVEPPPAEGPAGLLERSALLLSGLSILAALVATLSSAATSPDLLYFWGPKAQAFAAARTIDASFLRDSTLLYMHPSYPPLVTNLLAFASQVAGRFPWLAATLTLPLLLAALALALPGVLRLAAPRRLAWASSALILAALGYFGHGLGIAGNADPWLWIFEALAMAILIGPASLSRAGQLLAGLLLAGAVTAKVEGLLFALAAVGLFLLLRRKEIRIGRAAAFLLLPGVVSLGAWFWFEASRRVFYGYEQYGRFLEIHRDRLPLVLSGIGRALWSAGWGLPFLLPLAALLLAPARPRLLWLPVGVSLVLCVFSVFTYLHGDPDPSGWITWSAGRIFSPVPVLLAIAAVCRGGCPSNVRRERGEADARAGAQENGAEV
jgi:hypothetical protein